jgi:putative DNA primase/helicase
VGTGAELIDAVAALLELQERPQWVAWQTEIRQDKRTKVPYDAKIGTLASSRDPATWCEYATAARVAAHYDGVGFVVTEEDPYCGVDLDHCRNPETGHMAPWAAAIVRRLRSYSEVTPSSAGVRVWVRGTLPPGGRKRGSVEMYDDGRYFTVTGAHLPGTPTTIEARQAELERVHHQVFGVRAAIRPISTSRASELDDDRLLERARQAANGAKFERLYGGDWTGYPSQSEGDAALCRLLSFWAGRDPARVDRLFRRSALYRPKWDAPRGRETYGERTIRLALGAGRA